MGCLVLAVAIGMVVLLANPAGAAVAPTVSIVNPKDGGIVSVSFKVQVQAWDTAAPVTDVKISTNNGGDSYPYIATKNTNYSPGTGSAIWDYTFTSLATGSYTLKALATSASGQGFSRSVAITVVAAGTGDGTLLARDNSSVLCMDCHALSAHSSQFTSTKYGNWETVCRDCHTPHNTENIFLIKETINTPTSGPKAVQFRNTTGDATDSYTLSGATTPTNICQVCHTQTKNPTSLAARWRNTGNADTHFTAGTGTQRCTNCHQHSLGFRPESPGSIECTQCHSKQWSPMNTSTTTYHMYMQNAAASTLSPENSRYPQQAAFGSGDVESDHRRCLMCHADMDIFSPSNNPASPGRAYNLRTGVGTVPLVNDTTTYTNTDFRGDLASGGICLSCHTNVQMKNTTKRKDDGSTRTPSWNISQFSVSAHNYTVSSTFSDGSTFNANCVKCHNDSLTKDNQTSTYTFGLHDSSYRRMLSSLGLTGATDPLEEQFCYRCHTSDTSVKPANRDYYNATNMTTAAQGIAGVFAGGATVGDKVGARIVNNSYFTMGLGTVNALTAFNSTDPTIQGAVGGEVTFSRTRLTAASIYPGQQRIAVMSLSVALATAGQTGIWSGAVFSRTGTSTDAEVAGIQVYDDSGSVAGTFDANDALMGTGAFSAGTAFVNFSRRQSIVSTTARTYYVVVALASSLTSGHTMTIDMTGAAFASGFTTAAFPLSSNAWTFSTTSGTVTAAFSNPVAANQNQGRPGVLISNFTLTTNTGGALWTALRIDRAGTGTDGDVSRVRVYNDRGSTAASFDAGDQELSSGVFSGGTVTISLSFPQILTTTASRFYIVYDIAAGAVVTDQLRSSLAAASYFTLSFGTMASTNLPNTSNAMTVIATTAGNVNVAGTTNLAPASVTVGQDRVGIETFTLATASGNALWTALRVDRYSTGTSVDDDVATVEIYNDTGATAGTFDTSDRVIGTGILSGGSASVTLTYPQWLTTTATRYYVVYDYGAFKSKHPIAKTSGIHKPEERETASAPWNYGANRHVQCEDCHNPHASKAGTHTAGSNLAGGVLTGIWGLGISGYSTPTPGNPPNDLQNPSTLTYTRTGGVTYESELCLKCHSYYAWTTNTRPNVPSGHADGSTAQVTDQSAEFNPNNLAHHAVMGTGRNQPIQVGLASYYNTNWPAFTTGTVSTSGTAVTFSNAIPSSVIAGWYLYIGASAPAQGATAWYQIASVIDSTHATLTTSAGNQTNVASRLTAGLGNTFVPPYGPWSTLTCSGCHGSNVSTDPGGPHASAGRWVLTEADLDLNFQWWNGTSVITVTPNKVAVGGSTSAFATPKIFCFNCHRRDVYGDENLDGVTATYANLARVSHDPTGNANTFESGGTNKWGILCMNCHGGGDLGVIHGTNAGKGASGNSFRGKRFLYGATWTGVTRATTTTAVACWTKNSTDSVNVCTQGHGGSSGNTANYDYESAAD